MNNRQAIIAALLSAIVAATVPAVAQQPAAPSAKAPQVPNVRLGTKPQELYLTKITVSDLPRSLDFYTKVIGLKLVTSPDMQVPKPPAPGDPEKDFVEVAMNYSGSMADPLFVLMKRKGKVPAKEFTELVDIGFKVPSVQAVFERATAAGHRPASPYADGRPGFLSDPDGYRIELVQAPSFESR